MIPVKTTGDASSLTMGPAYFNLKSNGKNKIYVDDAIEKVTAQMNSGDATSYHSWKAYYMLKAALLSAKRKWEKAIVLYEAMAEQAMKFSDYFSVMEGYRISGYLHYLKGTLEPAFERCLLALVVGSYLGKAKVRQPTFLHAAYLALSIGKKIKSNEELLTLEVQLENWLGEDWRQLIENSALKVDAAKPNFALTPFIS